MAASGIIGSLCAIIPNLCFAVYCFRYKGAQAAKKILASFFFAEALKFILVFSLLWISYSMAGDYKWLSPVGVLAGFIFLYVSILLLPLITKK